MTKTPTDGKSPIPAPDRLAQMAEAAVTSAGPEKGPERGNGPTSRALPPVDLWHPPFGGDMDMRITRDGTWVHEGRPITRPGLVRLFASILRRDPDGYKLVTPVEMFRIQVEDAPFVAVSVEVDGDGPDQTLRFTTNLGEEVTADPDHPLRVEIDPATGEPAPYIRVRGGLDARIDRKSFYRMIDLGGDADHEGARWFGIWSGGCFFPIMPSDALEE